MKSGAFTAAKGLEFLYVFHADGTLTESSTTTRRRRYRQLTASGAWSRATAPCSRRSTSSSRRRRPRRRRSRPGAGWLPSGRGVFTERITVSADGRTLTSTIRYDLFDAAGRRTDGGEATGRGTRIDF